MLGSQQPSAEPAKAELGPASELMIFKARTVYSFMTSFPPRAPCHSAADLISRVLAAVLAVPFRGCCSSEAAAAASESSERCPDCACTSSATTFYVLAAPDTPAKKKILLDSLLLFQLLLLRMCGPDGRRWRGTSLQRLLQDFTALFSFFSSSIELDEPDIG